MKTIKANLAATVTESVIGEYGITAYGECGKVKASIWISSLGYVQVVCMNASNAITRGLGKRYESMADAVAAYKSPEMKAILAAFDALNH